MIFLGDASPKMKKSRYYFEWTWDGKRLFLQFREKKWFCIPRYWNAMRAIIYPHLPVAQSTIFLFRSRFLKPLNSTNLFFSLSWVNHWSFIAGTQCQSCSISFSLSLTTPFFSLSQKGVVPFLVLDPIVRQWVHVPIFTPPPSRFTIFSSFAHAQFIFVHS